MHVELLEVPHNDMRAAVAILLSTSWWMLFCISQSNVDGAASAGGYEIKIESVSRCSEKSLNGKDSLKFTSKMHRISRNKLIVLINATFATALTDKQKLLVNVAKHTNQGWKNNYFIVDFPKACTFVFSVLGGLRDYFEKNYKVTKCPIPPGNFSLPVDLQMKSIDAQVLPLMSIGKSRARAFIHEGSETLTCVECIFEYVPSKKNG